MNIMIKPASGLCNLRCKYCFYLDTLENREVKNYGFMSIETLENLVKNATDFAGDILTIAFQGGEPTLVGLDFYKSFIEFCNKYKKPTQKINFAIQTNGIVIDDEWAMFLKENNFLVGISLDGTKESHDNFRVFEDGKGTYNAVFNAIKTLEKHKVDFNILTVVNSITAKKIQTIYNFFKKSGFEYLQFIPCLQPFGKEGEKLPFTLFAKDFGNFLCNLFDLWHRDFLNGTAPHIRQFENYIEMLLGYPPESCGMSGVCSMQHIIEADGQCYPCDFYVLDEYKLGNVNEVDFNAINDKRKELKFVEDSIKFNDKCRSCKFGGICRGGCKRYCEPFLDDGTRSLNLLCEGYEKFFSHSLSRLQQTAKLISMGGMKQ